MTDLQPEPKAGDIWTDGRNTVCLLSSCSTFSDHPSFTCYVIIGIDFRYMPTRATFPPDNGWKFICSLKQESI